MIELSKTQFDVMDDEFKDAYYMNYMTVDDFERVRRQVVSFQHDNLRCQDVEYVGVLITSDRYKFHPGLYHRPTNTLQKCCYVKLKCETCHSVFTSNTLETHKNQHKIMCKTCCGDQSTRIKICTTKNCQDVSILYQSKFELKFIKYCNEHKIVLNNGPLITYEWPHRESARSCRIHFEIPQLNKLVELKECHSWHKELVVSGKWPAKERAANEYGQRQEPAQHFEVVFPDRYVAFVKAITRDYKQKENEVTKI